VLPLFYLQQLHELSDRILKLYDDDAVCEVFKKYKDSGKDTLNPENLPEALLDLDVAHHVPTTHDPLTLDDFKRIARQPSEAEQWIQMVPLAGLMARAFGKKDLDGLEALQPGDMSSGLLAFSEGVRKTIEGRLQKLKHQKAKLRDLPSGESKFGGLLEGGSVDDFHHGLSDRLGNC